MGHVTLWGAAVLGSEGCWPSTSGPHPLNANVTAKDVSRSSCVSPGGTPLCGDPCFNLCVPSHPTCTAVPVLLSEESGLGARCGWDDAPRPFLRHGVEDRAPAGGAAARLLRARAPRLGPDAGLSPRLPRLPALPAAPGLSGPLERLSAGRGRCRCTFHALLSLELGAGPGLPSGSAAPSFLHLSISHMRPYC